MNMTRHILGCMALALLAACTDGRRDKAETDTPSAKTGEPLAMPVLDLEKEYPKKTIALQDIADVEYIVLETHDDGLVGSHYTTVTDSFIITSDGYSNVVFFHRDGRFSHSFNRKGGSGEEYISFGHNLCVNAHSREVYIYDFERSRIQVYSYEGVWRRTLKVESDGFVWGTLYPFDANHLLMEDKNNVGNRYGKPTNPRPYYKVAVSDGETTRLPLTAANRIGNTVNWYDEDTGQSISISRSIAPISTINGEPIIAPFVLDTLYACRDGNLVPIAKKQNWMKEDGTPWLVTLDGISDKYYLWYAIEKKADVVAWRERTFLQDRHTGACAQIRLVDRNITDEGWRFRHRASASEFCVPPNSLMQCYPAWNLADLHERGKLQGELRDIASRLNAEDNPVIMLAKFKE